MATSKLVVRKNGIPVKRFWTEKATARTRETHSTTYPVYMTSSHSPNPEHFDTVWSLKDERAPRTLEEALKTAQVMVHSTEQPQTHAAVYELRLLYRVGVEFDWNAHTAEQNAQRAAAEQQRGQFKLVSTTATEGEYET